jgi:hypothetical protein
MELAESAVLAVGQIVPSMLKARLVAVRSQNQGDVGIEGPANSTPFHWPPEFLHSLLIPGLCWAYIDHPGTFS